MLDSMVQLNLKRSRDKKRKIIANVVLYLSKTNMEEILETEIVSENMISPGVVVVVENAKSNNRISGLMCYIAQNKALFFCTF